MIANRNVSEVKVYLELNQIQSREHLADLLMKRNRWLSTEEVAFMLSAHGKLSSVITEYSYPIYSPDFSHFLLKSNHQNIQQL